MELAREAAIKAYEEKQRENKQMANILKEEGSKNWKLNFLDRKNQKNFIIRGKKKWWN